MEPLELAMTALRAVGVYLLMLFVIRLMGKRTVGMFTAFDLLVALMLGEVVDEIIYGDVTFSQGTVAIVIIALATYLTSWLCYWDHGFDKILEGEPTVVVRDGRLIRRGMRKEHMNEKEVMSELRLNGIEDIREVRLATVESEGDVSVIKHEWAEAIQKADLGGEAAQDKKKRLEQQGNHPQKASTLSDGLLSQED
jgi:uncharacterized membrane protein YcaP (DUF421 family)